MTGRGAYVGHRAPGRTVTVTYRGEPVTVKTGWNMYEMGVGRLARAGEMVPQNRTDQQVVFHGPTEADR